jgi:hypothetical protein
MVLAGLRPLYRMKKKGWASIGYHFGLLKKTGRSKDRTGFTHEKTPGTSAREEICITIYQTIQCLLYPKDRPALFVRSAHRRGLILND